MSESLNHSLNYFTNYFNNDSITQKLNKSWWESHWILHSTNYLKKWLSHSETKQVLIVHSLIAESFKNTSAVVLFGTIVISGAKAYITCNIMSKM